jgi:protein-tyrosine phosphatase
MFGPKWKREVDKARARGVAFLELEWNDQASQDILPDLAEAAAFIHAARTAGSDCLVHCAQVFSSNLVSP